MRRSRRRPEHHENPERWLVSYADFITLLFAFFTTLYAISVVDVEKAERLVESLNESFNEGQLAGELAVTPPTDELPGNGSAPSESTRLELLGDRVRELNQEAGMKNGLSVRQTEEGLVITLADTLFFSGGGAAIPEQARPELARIAELLQSVPNHVRVEGHTDDRPIGSAQFPSNWHLSAVRAVEIVRGFVEAGVPSYRLSASGFASERPLVSNDTAEGRAINRRVDIVVLRARLSDGDI